MTIYFVTGNKNKFEEASAVIPGLVMDDTDLPEIQSADPEAIAKHKLEAMIAKRCGDFMVDDTSLHLDCLGGMPGPLIKWFLQANGTHGIFKIADALEDYDAQARCTIGLYQEGAGINYFEGLTHGRIVSPSKGHEFGWDCIFMPRGYDQTYAEMSRELKNEISHRAKALGLLKDHLANQ